MKRIAAMMGLVFFLLFIGGSASGKTVGVTINDGSFAPSSITVTKGDTVRWVPKGSASHTVTAKDGSFNSDASGQCQSSHYAGCLVDGDDDSPGLKKEFTHTFNNTGTYGYTCKVHGFSGTVKVEPKPTPAPTAAPKTQAPATAAPAPAPATDATQSPAATEEPVVSGEPTPSATVEAVPLTAEETGGDSNSGILVAGILGGVVVGGGLVALALTRLRRPA